MKPVRLFPLLESIDDFIIKDHPILHPDSKAYSDYWEQQERYCVEGKWGKDGEKWRYCPGNLYYYANFTVIEDEDDKKSTELKRPRLRDIDWYITYGWLTARGFSGFMDDNYYTCNVIIKKIEEGIPLTPSERLDVERLLYLKKEDGTFKKYIEAREYLYNKCERPMGLPIYDNPSKNLFLLSTRGLGKDLEENTLVYTVNGPIKIKDINIGDQIYGADGKLTTVVSKDYYNDQLQYEITFDDNRKIECGEGHIWNVCKAGSKNFVNLELKEFKDDYLSYTRSNGRRDRKYFIKYCSPIEYPKKDLLIDPYLLGLWLGDGSKHRAAITTADNEIRDYIYDYADKNNYKISININKSKTCPTYHLVQSQSGSELSEAFKSYKLFNNKHIPSNYLYSSVEDRFELLKGLMDSDGSCYENGGIEFSNINEQIIKDLSILLNSLGIKHFITERITKYTYGNELKNGKKSYRVNIRTNHKIFKLKRKHKNQVLSKEVWTNSSRNRVGIKSIIPTSVKPSICIGVNNDDNLFVAGDYIVTHNSFYVANAVIGHEFNFYGKKYYNDYIMDSAKGPQIFVGASLSSKSSDLLKKFDLTQEYHKANNGSFGSGDDLVPGFFYRNCTGTLTSNNSKSPYIHQYEVKEGGVKRKLGSKTTLYHGTYTTENPDAAVGTRPTIMVVEECGLVENIIPVHLANEQCQFRKTKFGSSFYIGTGGNIDKIVGCKLIFDNPREYQFLEYPDLWEDRQYPIGLFIPAYYGNTKFLDELGNTKIELAFEQEIHERELREKSKSSAALDGYRMSRPLVPSEMFLSKASFVFPVMELRERQMELDVKKIWEKNVSIGDLEWADVNKRSVRWVEDMSSQKFSKPINQLNLDSFGGDLTGKICIYEHPHDIIPEPNMFKSLYKVVYDPIKDDEYGTSLASVLVYKGFTNLYNDGLQGTIVAEWIGRYNQVYDAHLMAIKLAMYYNAKILAENNFPNFITFCRSEGYYQMLQRTPWLAIKDAVNNPGRKYDVGVTMSTQLNINCEQLIRQWLLDPFIKLEDRMLTNISNLYSFRLINELAAYSREGNFDHVSSFKLLMLWISQERKEVFTDEDVKPDKFYTELKDFNKFNALNNQIEHENWYKY